MFHTFFAFIALPSVQSALNHLINWLGHVANINIWSYNLKFSEKIVLYFHFTAIFYVQGARKKLKTASFIEHAIRFRIRIIIINIPYYALKFIKEKCFILPFLLCLYCTVLCAGFASNESLNHLHRARLRKNKEALQISVLSSLFLSLVEIDFFIVSFHFTELCTGHSTKKAHNHFRYRAHLRLN